MAFRSAKSDLSTRAPGATTRDQALAQLGENSLCDQQQWGSLGSSDESLYSFHDIIEDVMTRVPLEMANTETKARLAEYILKTAAQGHTTYNELIAAATDHIQLVASIFT